MPLTKGRKTGRFFLLLRIGVVVVGLIWAALWFSRHNLWGRLGQLFIEMNLLIFVSVLVISAAGQLIIAFRWWLLLRSQSIVIGIAPAVRLHFLGLFYNNFMPSSVGGDLIRAWYVTHHTSKRLEAALSVFVDRLIGLASTLTIAGFFYFLFMRGRGAVLPVEQADSGGGFIGGIAAYWNVFIWVFVMAAGIFCVLLLHRQGRLVLSKAWASVRAHGVRIIGKMSNAVIIYWRSPWTILCVFALTVLMQLMVITGFWLLGRELGIEAELKYYYVFFTLTWVLGAIPVSIGGVVVVEVLLASLFINFAGVAEDSASALALCQRAAWMLISLPGAVIHVVGGHLPAGGEESGQSGREFSIDEDKVRD